MIHVLVVGQTPPPFGGQAVMIETLLAARFSRVRLFHVRMGFSRDMADMGRPRAGKALHLARVLAQIASVRARHRIDVLYYPPSGPSRVAMLRDVALLVPARRLFPKTLFHLHAGGTSDLYPTLSTLEKALFRLAYGHPDCTVRVSGLAPDDGARMQTRRDVVIPYGIADASRGVQRQRERDARPRILFAGVLRESKGVRVLLEAARTLATEGLDFEVVLLGAWGSAPFAQAMTDLVATSDLRGRVSFPGVLTGAAKHQAFADADVFCFPTYFEAETFGLVAIEAMSFALPVIATSWRGLPSIVADGRSGFLVPPRDVDTVAARLRELLTAPETARAMGKVGRGIFLERYTLERFLERMEQVFVDVATSKEIAS